MVFCSSLFKVSCFVSWFLFLSGCASFGPDYENHGVLVSEGKVPVLTETKSRLRSLPEPLGKVVVAVYGFQDYTGQKKPSPSSAFSSAVTQGADSILIRALIDSNWFSPMERSNLKHLLTERQLWSEKVNAGSVNKKTLKPLTPANVLIEGGIISYDYNIRTGGAGVKYLGIGGDDKYREDMLTVNLRLVNAIDGAILHSIDVSKTVYSKSRNRGLFGYVEFDRLAELEAGYAYNEPVQLAVVEAIESALVRLIAEGIKRNTWGLKHARDITHPSFYSIGQAPDVAVLDKPSTVAVESSIASKLRYGDRTTKAVVPAESNLETPKKTVQSDQPVQPIKPDNTALTPVGAVAPGS